MTVLIKTQSLLFSFLAAQRSLPKEKCVQGHSASVVHFNLSLTNCTMPKTEMKPQYGD